MAGIRAEHLFGHSDGAVEMTAISQCLGD